MCKAYDRVVDSIKKTRQTLRDIKLMDLDVRERELTIEERKVVVELAKSLRDNVELQRVDQLFRYMKVRPLAEVKMWLALYRRIDGVEKFQRDKNIEL